MRVYFTHDGSNESGPFTLEQLKLQNIIPETNVWTEGMPNWSQAKNFPELQSLWSAIPPAFPFSETTIASTKGTNKKLWLYISIGFLVVTVSAWAVINNGSSGSNTTDNTFADTGKSLEGVVNPTDSIISTKIVSPPESIIDTTTTLSTTYDEALTIPTTDTTVDVVNALYTNDLRKELIAKEQERPLDYLTISTELSKNLLDENVFRGSVTNHATAAPFKDIVVHVTYYSGTDTELFTDDFVLYKYVAAGTTANFKIKRSGTPKEVKKYRLTIVNATPAE